MGKLYRFFAEAGSLGVGGVIFAFVLWAIALEEHYRNQNVPAVWFLLGGCLAFCFGAFMAWSKADDRANERKPRLAFSADLEGFYLTHLQGDPARFVEVSPLVKPNGTSLRFDPVDFLGPNNKQELRFRLNIVGDVESDVRKIVLVMFEVGTGRPEPAYTVTVSFRWNKESLKESVRLLWVQGEMRFETKPFDAQ